MKKFKLLKSQFSKYFKTRSHVFLLRCLSATFAVNNSYLSQCLCIAFVVMLVLETRGVCKQQLKTRAYINIMTTPASETHFR